MRTVNIRIAASAALSLALLLLPAMASAQLDFSRYVSLGDSITAGFISGSLIDQTQNNSYPAQIARRAGAADFQQPLVSPPGIPPVLQLQALSPLTIEPLRGLGQPLNLTLPRPYNNLAVPGAEVSDVLNTVTDNGGLHDLILRGIGTQVQQALAQQPSFVTLWAGNNDVLAAATSGIVIEDVTLTSLAAFETAYRRIAGAVLSSPGLTGAALVNLPSVTAIPFVTTLPPVLIDPATNQPVVIGGAPVPLIGPDGPLGLGDFVLLTASELLARGIGIPAAVGGTGQPLPDNAVLSAGEAATIEARVGEINSVIASVASEFGVALVDANGIFNDIVANGLNVGGLEYSPDFLTGGIFSFDGVHPSPFGYAFIAQQVIEAVNARYGSNIPAIDFFPFVFGNAGLAPGVAVVNTAPGELLFSRRAYKNLRFALDIPKTRKLLRLKRRQARAEQKAGQRVGRLADAPEREVGERPQRRERERPRVQRQQRDRSPRRARIER